MLNARQELTGATGNGRRLRAGRHRALYEEQQDARFEAGEYARVARVDSAANTVTWSARTASK